MDDTTSLEARQALPDKTDIRSLQDFGYLMTLSPCLSTYPHHGGRTRVLGLHLDTISSEKYLVHTFKVHLLLHLHLQLRRRRKYACL